MKILIVALLLALPTQFALAAPTNFALAEPSATGSDSDIVGNWHYDGFFYQDHRYPKPDADLNVEFTFNADHTERLYWKRTSETGFCERKANWEFANGILKQEVTWINPANDPSCAKDPDMQMPRVTQNKVELYGAQFNMHMDLNGQDFIYILIR